MTNGEKKAPAVGLAVLLALAAAAPAGAQDVWVQGGQGTYEADAFCLGSNAFITTIGAGVGTSMGEVTATYINNDYPWWRPPGWETGGASVYGPAATGLGQAQEEYFQTRGEAISAIVQLFPLGIVRRLAQGAERRGALGALDSYLRPFVGIGVQVTGDGAAESASESGRNLDTWSTLGSTNLVVTYGARLYLPSLTHRVRLQIDYRATSLFGNEAEWETPEGEVVPGDIDTVTWGTLSVGLSYAIR